MFQEACNNNSVTLNTVFIQPIVYVVVYSNGETMKSHVLYATNGLIPTDFRIVNSMRGWAFLSVRSWMPPSRGILPAYEVLVAETRSCTYVLV